MDFPLDDLLDEEKCYEFLVSLLHRDGLTCPNGHPLSEAYVHMRDRAPVLDYRCKACGRFFNVFTGTVFQCTKHGPARIVQILRGIAKGVSTAELARELDVDRKGLLQLRHRLQAFVEQTLPGEALSDLTVESDEMFQNAGEKRRSAPRSRRSA